MKRAKKRLPPILARLISSTRRADRAITRAIAAVQTSEKRILPKPKYSLAEIILQMPEGLPIDREWDEAPPVGREIL